MIEKISNIVYDEKDFDFRDGSVYGRISSGESYGSGTGESGQGAECQISEVDGID